MRLKVEVMSTCKAHKRFKKFVNVCHVLNIGPSHFDRDGIKFAFQPPSALIIENNYLRYFKEAGREGMTTLSF